MSVAKYCYYDIPGKWTRKIQPHLSDARLNEILVRDFNKFTTTRWDKPFTLGMLPEQIESCDWRCDHRGKYPRYWKYVKHSACHFVVNFALRLAMLVEPDREWRIVTSKEHSTVWDGKRTFFDFNFLALGVSASECAELAFKGQILKPGKFKRIYGTDHWTSS